MKIITNTMKYPQSHPANGIFGLAVGDALGVPVEFNSREELKINPVTSMRGYGTHQMPPGTWSDDTSLALCLTDSLIGGLNYNDIMQRFLSWLDEGAYSPFCKAFDYGQTTFSALIKYSKGIPALECGGKSKWDNGNGSLMRILPLTYYLNKTIDAHITESDDAMEIIHNVSSLTHGHQISQISCGIYLSIASVFLQKIKPELSVPERITHGIKLAADYYFRKEEYHEFITDFSRLISDDFINTNEDDIKRSGYVIYTLEAAVWSLLTTDNYCDCVLKAVNLGEDADTVACVAGGLAGIIYGYQSIPDEWIDKLVKREFIEDICCRFDDSLSNK